MKQHFFMFSSGPYWDYCVRGLYVSDHLITEKEWDVFVADKEKLVEKAKQASIDAYGKRTGDLPHGPYGNPGRGWTSSEEYSLWKEYQASQDAQELFVKMHGLVKVDVTELWRE